AETQKKQEQQIINLSEEVKKILEKDEVIKKLEKRNQDLESILETHTKLLDEKSNKIKELEQKPSLDGDEKSRKKTQEEVKNKSESDYRSYSKQRQKCESLAETIDKFIGYTEIRNIVQSGHGELCYRDYFAYEERLFRSEKEQEVYNSLKQKWEQR
ncbi:28878_t:CDS:2, partial [Racocetra persica]